MFDAFSLWADLIDSDHMRVLKVISIVVGTLTALVLALSAPAIGKLTADYLFDKPQETAGRQEIEQLLQQSAEQLNRQLSSTPVSGDQIKLESVAVGPANQLTFNFTVYQHNELSDEDVRGLFFGNRDRICSGNLRWLLDRGVSFNYRYQDSGAKWARDVTVKPADCRP